MWRKELEFFSDLQDEIKNPEGRSRTLEENKFILMAILRELHQRVQFMDDGHLHPSEITWYSIETAVARDFCVWPNHVTDLQCNFLMMVRL